MNNFKRFFFPLLFCVCFLNIPAYAVYKTPAARLRDEGYIVDVENGYFYDESGEKYDLSYYTDDPEDEDSFYEDDENFYPDSYESFIATPSYYFSSSGNLSDYFVPLEDEPNSINTADELVDDEPVELRNNRSVPVIGDKYKNVVIYQGTFNNSSVRLVIPYEDYEKLSVIDGVLCNVGNSSVTGRFLYNDEELDPNIYDTYSYILVPVYGNTNNVYRYGSFNYRRHYYVNNYNNIAYDDLYGKFYVSDCDVYYATSQRGYYLGLIGLIFGGLCLCLKR